jgi:site-specific DNA recombinase
MVIATGGGRRGYVKYGCHGHKHTGVCENKLMIRQDRLEAQLLAAIEERILSPALLNQVIAQCEVEVCNGLAVMERSGSVATLESLKRDLDEKKRRQARIITAIETAGDIDALTGRLRNLETRSLGSRRRSPTSAR